MPHRKTWTTGRLSAVVVLSLIIWAIIVAVALATSAGPRTHRGPRSARATLAAPGRLRGAARDGRIVLTWKASRERHGRVAGYRVYRNNRPLARVRVTRYADAHVIDGKTYRYYVIAYDASGRRSRASNVVRIRLRRVTRPTPVTGGGPNGGAPNGGAAGAPDPGNGLSSDPNFFPILVWDQSGYNASAYRSVGVNVYENGVSYSSSDLAEIKATGLWVIECSVTGRMLAAHIWARTGTAIRTMRRRHARMTVVGIPRRTSSRGGWFSLMSRTPPSKQVRVAMGHVSRRVRSRARRMRSRPRMTCRRSVRW